MASSPMAELGTSVTPWARSCASMESAASTAALAGTGRRVSALARPLASLSRSNSSRRPLRLSTVRRADSIRS